MRAKLLTSFQQSKKMKNPFKKSSIVDTIINVGVGGAANVAMDYARAQISTLASLEDTTYNAIKIAVGALGGSMSKNKYVRAAVDGIATVGAANLISGYITPDAAPSPTPSPDGTGYAPFIGRLRAGQRGYRRAIRGTGKVGSINGEPFMSK